MLLRNGILVMFLLAVVTGCEPVATVEQTPPQNLIYSKPITTAFFGKCIKVVDGDTVDVLVEGNQTIRVRLESIDCPERGQPFGSTATEYVKQAAITRQVAVYQTGVDTRYDRLIGFLYVGNRNINAELVANGLAWHYKKYSTDPAMNQMELNAQTGRLGIWQDPRAIPPWDWRKMAKAERDLYR